VGVQSRSGGLGVAAIQLAIAWRERDRTLGSAEKARFCRR